MVYNKIDLLDHADPRIERDAEGKPIRVWCSARSGEGVHTLLSTVADVIEGKIVTKPKRVEGTPEFQHAVSELVPMIEEMAPGIPNARWLAIRLLDGDAKVQQALMSGEFERLVSRQQQADVQFSRKMAVEGRQ